MRIFGQVLLVDKQNVPYYLVRKSRLYLVRKSRTFNFSAPVPISVTLTRQKYGGPQGQRQ